MANTTNDYPELLLENQLCFPLYACSKEIIKRYRPFLDELGLTYTQYLVMLVLWEKQNLTSKELGQMLYLDSGTLTPVSKKLEEKGLLSRRRSGNDERNLLVWLTEDGDALKLRAAHVPQSLAACVKLDAGEARELYRLLYKFLGAL
ncbi:MAG: MarR family transcriptional regulator [Clostridia bacterium]|nr:MarR family transcriptional regulator [Clostridia bacterium]